MHITTFRSRRELLAVVVGLAAAVLVVVAFIHWIFPAVFALFWGTACGTFDTWLVCSTFLQHGFTTGILAGIAAPLVGAYVVNRQMALIGEALAHTAFGGVAIGLVVGASVEWANYPLLFALAAAILAALGLQYLAIVTETYGDIPLAIMLTGGFAVGVGVISYGEGIAFGRELHSYLFGNILFVPFENVQLMVGLTMLVVGMVALFHKQFLFITFDREAARLARINVVFYDTVLIVVTALVVVAAMQIMGAVLVAALVVVPVAAAMQVTRQFTRGLILAIGYGQVAVVVGILGSYYLDVASGPAIVIVAILLYLAGVIGNKL